MKNVEYARERLLAAEYRLQHVEDHVCSHDSPSSEAASLTMPLTQDIDAALREIRIAQSALDTALITAGLSLTDPIFR